MADITIDSKSPSRARSSSAHPLESDLMHMHPLVSWRSIIGGLFVAFLCLAILLSLGMAFGGIGLDDGTSAQRAGIFTGVWFLISAILSLFAGSYFAARISKFHTNRLGSAQGLVIASLFFAFFLWQTFSALGWAGRTATSAVSGAANVVGMGANQAAQSPMVTNIVENSLGDLNFRSEPQAVLSGVASRLLSGDVQGAKTYLANQTPGVTTQEINQRVDQLQTQVNQAVVQARDTAATALQATGWSLFATLVLGAAAAISGGALGSRANLRKPLTREQVEAVSDLRPATV